MEQENEIMRGLAQQVTRLKMAYEAAQKALNLMTGELPDIPF